MLQICLFFCTHNINKTFSKIKKTNRLVLILCRNTSQILNRNTANTYLTDMINIFIECCKLLFYKEIIQIKNYTTISLAYVIRKDLFLSKGTSISFHWNLYGLHRLRKEFFNFWFDFIQFYLYVCMNVCSLGRCAKIVFALLSILILDKLCMNLLCLYRYFL